MQCKYKNGFKKKKNTRKKIFHSVYNNLEFLCSTLLTIACDINAFVRALLIYINTRNSGLFAPIFNLHCE